jgi:hypothetical protein
MQFYRLLPGDVGIGDIPSFKETAEEGLKDMADLLRDYQQDNAIPPNHRPHHARLIAHNGAVLGRLRAVPGGVERIQEEDRDA